MVEIKNRIEARLTAEGSDATVLKTAPGGVRDIEFIAQCLQLLMGGTRPDVRVPGTLVALERLHSAKALSEGEHTILSDSYLRYRAIENALQWRELLPAFTLPENQDDRAVLAGALAGHPVTQDETTTFFKDLDDRMNSVRAVYGEVFSVRGEDAASRALRAATSRPGDEVARRYLEGLGFHYATESMRVLARLTEDESGKLPVTGVHPAVKRFLPLLLTACSDLPDLGGALERFERIVTAYHSRHVLMDILSDNEQLFTLLLTAAHSSVYVTDILSQDPSLLDWLVEGGAITHPLQTAEVRQELTVIARDAVDDTAFTSGCRAVRDHEHLRIAVRDISGIASTMDTFSELSAIADALLAAAYARAVGPRPPFPFAMLAAGRLGAGMMDFGSDLDLVFIYDNLGDMEADTPGLAVALAQRISALLTGGGGPIKVYDVDARLRPDGGNSPLAVSLDEYRHYLDGRAAGWERLALIRTRPITGNTRLGSQVMRAIHAFCFGPPMTADEITHIRVIRNTMIEQSRTRHPGTVNVKSGPGGIADIDFIAQTLAVNHGGMHPEFRRTGTPEILGFLAEAGILPRSDAAVLVEHYGFLCDVEKALRIGSGRSINALPPDGTETSRVARLLGFRNIRRFSRRLEEIMSVVHERYERIMDGFVAGNGDVPASP